MSYLEHCMTRAHCHEGVEIIGCFSGRVRIETSRQPAAAAAGASLEDACIVPGGSLIVLNCRHWHRVSVLSPPYGRWLIHIADRELWTNRSALPPISLFARTGISPKARVMFQLIFQRLFAAVSSARGAQTEWTSRQLSDLLGLAAEILRAAGNARHPNTAQPSDAVSSVIATIHTAMHDGVSVDRLAQRVGYSTAHLQRLFQAEMGLSISQYVAMQRLEQAGRLLMGADGQHHVGSIADALGFSDVAYFSRYFRRHTGLSPMQYRHHLLAPGA